MKHSFLSSRRSKYSGFTLVELLVVIGIIAILASVLLSAGNSAIRSAQRAKASNLASQLQAACLSYFTEYSVYPVPPNTTGDYVIKDTDAASWKNLVIALSGNIDPANPGTPVANPVIANTRAISFITLQSSDLVTGTDAPKNPLPPNAAQLYFNIAMDNDYDGVLGGNGASTAALPNFNTSTLGNVVLTGGSSTAGVAVWANCNGNATGQNPAYWVHTY